MNPGGPHTCPCPAAAPLPASCSRADLDGPSVEGGDSLGLALQLLRSETVKVYVNNEINILVFFFFFLSPLRFHTHSKCALV